MRDRRSTFTKEYINSVVNPLGNRPDPFGNRAAARVAAAAAAAENQQPQINRTVEEQPTETTEPEENQTMLMPSAASLGTSAEADGLVGSLGGLGVLGTTGTLNGGVQNKDTTFTKLFVGGLPYHTTDKSLRDHFAVYGDIEEAVVITDRQTGKSRGYGFVSSSARK